MKNKTSRYLRTRLASVFIALLSLTLSLNVYATEQLDSHKLEIQKLAEGVYALVGELSQRSSENFGNNSTHGVIVTNEGVVLVDSGGSYLGAKQIHAAIKSLTDQPVKWVINSGGQDHRWLGNGYFKALGAQIISSAPARADQQARADNQLGRLQQLIGDSLKGTEPTYADEVFDSEKTLKLGGVELKLFHVGPAHTLGDSFVWLAKQKIMFTGDIVFTERALGLGPVNNAQKWMAAFDAMAAHQPETVVPGHGHAADLKTARQDTYNYLDYLFVQVGQMLEAGVDLQDAVKLDQSQFSYLKVFEQISRKNAQSVYEQLEFDSF